jgi:hypothetical protein
MGKPKGQKIMRKYHLWYDANGALTTKRSEGVGPVIGTRFEFVQTGNTIDRFLKDLDPDFAAFATSHGIHQWAGDKGAGDDPYEAEEAVMARMEMLDAGTWYAERAKGEARPSFYAQAVFQYKTETSSFNEGETLEVLQARYAGKEGETWRKTAFKVKRVREIIEDLKDKAEAERKARTREQIAKMGDAASVSGTEL